jgi:hypothetical protein
MLEVSYLPNYIPGSKHDTERRHGLLPMCFGFQAESAKLHWNLDSDKIQPKEGSGLLCVRCTGGLLPCGDPSKTINSQHKNRTITQSPGSLGVRKHHPIPLPLSNHESTACEGVTTGEIPLCLQGCCSQESFPTGCCRISRRTSCTAEHLSVARYSMCHIGEFDQKWPVAMDPCLQTPECSSTTCFTRAPPHRKPKTRTKDSRNPRDSVS